MKFVSILSALAVAAVSSPAVAVPIDGFFIAQQACPAFQSFRNQTNPGGILVEPGRAYELIEINRPDGPSHYRMIIPGVAPQERWVAVGCGVRTVEAPDQPTPTPDGDGNVDVGDAGLPAGSDIYMLAASWQPGFCETQPDKVECLNQGEDRFDASHFALHGLWPQPQGREYCVGVTPEMKANDKPATWRLLPAVVIPAELMDRLKVVMPGTASFLERHEWLVHGTCYKEPMESYFAETLALMEDLNASSLVGFMVDNIDNSVTPAQIRAAVDAAFGPGAGDRVEINCKKEQAGNRMVLTELQLSLAGVITPDSDLGSLIHDGASQGAGNCPSVIIDRAGL